MALVRVVDKIELMNDGVTEICPVYKIIENDGSMDFSNYVLIKSSDGIDEYRHKDLV
jgi:hypothetical protein